MLTTDPSHPKLNRNRNDDNPGPQNEVYLVLSEEERAKGFVRPVRRSYKHQGGLFDKGMEMLDEPNVDNGKTYVAIATVILNEDGTRKGGRYITQEELDQHNRTDGYIGGCGTITTMGLALSETYARQPNFYGATYCCRCQTHLPVGEFRWDKDGEVVGS